MTSALIIGLALTFLLTLAIQALWITRAPNGWEDARAFHPGEEPYAGIRRSGKRPQGKRRRA